MKTNCLNSNSCLGAMKLCLAIVVCLSAIAWRPTDGVNCSAKKSFTCVESDFTLATCNLTTGACGCYSPNGNVYTAIRTGCAVSLRKPYLRTVDDRSSEFFPGSPVQLSCTPNDEATTFEWRRGGKVITGVTSGLLNLTGQDADKIGGFTCRVVDGTEQSEDSNTIDITEVSQLGLKELARVSDIPPYAVLGDTIDVKCSNIPFGATYKFMIDNNPKLEDTVTHDSKIQNIACVIDVPQGYTNSMKNMTGVPAMWYIQNASDIDSVRTNPSSDQTFRTGTPVNVTCVTVPEEKYLLAGGNTVTYTFTDYSNTSAIAYGNVYPVLSTTGSHTIVCSAKYGNKTPIASHTITLEFSDTYLATPVLSASSTTVALGSRLVLTCVDGGRTASRTIYWTKDDKIIRRQKDRIIQFGDFQESDAGRFACTVTSGYSEALSNEITVRANADRLRALGSTILLVLVALASSKIF